MKRLSIFCALAGLVLAGCGGGGGGSASPGSSSGTVSEIGPFTTRATTANPLQVVTAASGGPVFTGIAGGDFSSIVLKPQSGLNDSKILFSRIGGVYSMDMYGYNLQPVSSDVTAYANTSHPTWSPDRLRIAYCHYDQPYFQIYVANADGSNATRISSHSADEISPTWSPASNKIAFSRYDSSISKNQIYVRNSDGSSIARLSDRQYSDSNPAWSPDGSKIAFQRIVNGHTQIWVMNSSGSGAHQLSILNDVFQPAWSPNGDQIAFSYGTASNNIMVESVANPNNFRTLTNTSDSDYAPSWSPDSKYIAFTRNVAGTGSIWIVDLYGNGAHAITGGSGFGDDDPCWSPPAVSKTIVGSGGALGSSAAGFLFGMSGTAVKSVLAFDSGAPDNVTVTTNENTNPGDDNIIFQISGALNSIKFFNMDSQAVTVLPSGSTTSATGAVVSFDANTGWVAAVIPFSASRAVSRGRGVVEGDLLGVYDADGRNLAPNGARQVHLDPASGKVLSIQ